MGELKYNGTDELELSLADIAAMSDDDKKEILRAGAEAAVEGLKSVLERLRLRDTGQLIDGVAYKFKTRDGEPFAQISSYGKRKKAFTGKRRRGGSYAGTNTELLYLVEHGTPRMRSQHPLEMTENEYADAVTEAMAAAYDEYLKNKKF